MERFKVALLVAAILLCGVLFVSFGDREDPTLTREAFESDLVEDLKLQLNAEREKHSELLRRLESFDRPTEAMLARGSQLTAAQTSDDRETTTSAGCQQSSERVRQWLDQLAVQLQCPEPTICVKETLEEAAVRMMQQPEAYPTTLEKRPVTVEVIERQETQHVQMFRHSLPGFHSLFAARQQRYFAGHTDDGLHIHTEDSTFTEHLEKEIAEKNCGKTLKVGLCTLAGHEGRYLQEFIIHHLLLGFSKIFVYHNTYKEDDPFDMAQKAALAPFLDSGMVFDMPFDGGGGPWQRAVYRDFIAKQYPELDWVGYTDVDEFWVLPKHECVGTMIADKVLAMKSRKGLVGALKIPWRIFHSPNIPFVPPDKLLMEMHQHYFDSRHSKTIGLYNVTQKVQIHSINVASPYQGAQLDRSEAYLAHYMTRSLEDFLMKMTRGKSNAPSGQTAGTSQGYPMFADIHWMVPMASGPLSAEGFWRFEDYALGPGAPNTLQVKEKYAADIRKTLGLPTFKA